MDESLLEVIPRIEKRTHYLSSLANVGLLIGLLGTITGLIGAFSAVATANPAEKASLLAAAISVAMNNTASGLGRCHHAAVGAHVSRVEDHLADRQLGDCVGEIPEFDHGASNARTGASRRKRRRRRRARPPPPAAASRNSSNRSHSWMVQNP